METKVSRATSLGSLHHLPDIVIIKFLLTTFSAKELCTISLVSRYLHVFSRNDFVWRRLYFEERGLKPSRMVFRGNWMLTYIFPSPDQNEECSSHQLVTNPIRIQDVYSDYLYHQWTRSTMFFGHFYPPPPLPPTPATNEHGLIATTIPIEDYQSLDKDKFYQRYEYANKPVMFNNSGVESWPAWKDWTLDSLNTKYGDILFRVSNLDSDVVPTFKMHFSDFLHYIRYNKDQDPLYLFDSEFVERVPEMGKAYEVPKYFDNDFFSLLPEKERPPFRWILVGPQRTGAPWHTDPSGTSAWNTLLSGHKRWALYPPHIVPPGHDPRSPDRLSSVEWYLDVYPQLPPELRPIEIVQCPGQTIFVPSGWWHMVINMDDTVAVTQNFANEGNLRNVKRSMTSLRGNDDLQIRRWKKLAEEIPKLYPDLSNAVEESPEELALTNLRNQPSWLDPNSSDSLYKWQKRVEQVLQKVAGIQDAGIIIPIQTSENACFISKFGFVKFFTPLYGGHESYISEVKAYKLLEADKETATTLDILATPQMLGYGYYFEEDQVPPSGWRWPYIAMVNERQRDAGNRPEDVELTNAGDYIPRIARDYRNLLTPLLRTLKYLHTFHESHPVYQSVGSDSGEPKSSTKQLSRRLELAYMNHMRWRIFPRHLLKLLPAYLPSDIKLVFDPANGDPVATIVHGDVSPANLMGYLDIIEQVKSSELESELSNGAQKVTAINPAIPPPDFKLTTIIDFGDVIFHSDPLIDIVNIFISILNGQCDQEFTDDLIKYWKELEALVESKVGNTNSKSHITLRRRCMWHVLLNPSEGLAIHLVRCIPAIGEMSSWEEVEDAIFGWWGYP